MMYETADSQNLQLEDEWLRHWNCCKQKEMYYKSLWAGYLWSRRLWQYRSYASTSVGGSKSKSETIVRCFVHHLISAFRFDLHRRHLDHRHPNSYQKMLCSF